MVDPASTACQVASPTTHPAAARHHGAPKLAHFPHLKLKTNLCQKTTTALQPSTSIQSCPRAAHEPCSPPSTPPSLPWHATPYSHPAHVTRPRMFQRPSCRAASLPPATARAEGSAHQSVGVLACDALLNSEQQRAPNQRPNQQPVAHCCACTESRVETSACACAC